MRIFTGLLLLSAASLLQAGPEHIPTYTTDTVAGCTITKTFQMIDSGHYGHKMSQAQKNLRTEAHKLSANAVVGVAVARGCHSSDTVFVGTPVILDCTQEKDTSQ